MSVAAAFGNQYTRGLKRDVQVCRLNRASGFGRTVVLDPERARREIREELVLARGNMVRVAHRLAVTRQWLYRLIHRLGLVADLEAARATESEWLARTRAELQR